MLDGTGNANPTRKKCDVSAPLPLRLCIARTNSYLRMMAMSCRHILADENIILEIARKLGPCTSGGNGVRLRQRPLFTKTYRHDLKGDALSNVIEMLMQRYKIWLK